METTCPKCGSHDLHAGQKGFNDGMAAIGQLFDGPIGVAEGNYGSSKIIVTCIACGHQFYPGQKQKALGPPEWQFKMAKVAGIILGSIIVLISLIPLFSDSVGAGLVFLAVGGLMIYFSSKYKKRNP